MIQNLKSIVKNPSQAFIQITSRHFSILTNETLKKAFDSKVKEKFISSKKDEQDSDEQGFEDSEKIFKDTVRQTLSELDQEESILEGYRKQVRVEGLDDFTVQDQERIANKLDFLDKARSHFTNITEEEFMTRSKNLYDSLRLKTNWSPIPNEKISDEYLNYDRFNKNYTKVKDKQNDITDDGGYVLGKNVGKFMKNIDDKNLVDKVLQDNMIKTIRAEATTEKDAEIEIEDFHDMQNEDLRQLTRGLAGGNQINIGQPENRIDRDDDIYGRLSPHARESIYQLYLQGSTVRDLSIRFGILPERVKAVVWQRNLFYEEIMPKIDLTTVKLGLEMEMLYNMEFPWVDYGLDLVAMGLREKGMILKRYRKKDIDVKPLKEVQEKMMNILEKKGKKKYDIITEKFVGESTKGYFIKSWVVYKGHGSERVNKRFKDILKHEKNPHKLPYPIQRRLHKGPRIASTNYGIH